MSTPNFARCYLPTVYAIADDDIIDWDATCDDLAEYIAGLVPGAQNVADTEKWYSQVGYQGGQVLVEAVRTLGNWTITHEVVVMSGYYGGINLDLVVTVECDKHNTNFIISSADRDNFDDIPNSIGRAIDSRDRVFQKALTKVTTPLLVVGIFSNGEAVYREIKK